MDRIRIDHLNAFYGGGAAIAARRVHESLRSAGQHSQFWYIHGDEVDDPSYHRWSPQPNRGAGRVGREIKKHVQHALYRKRIRRALRGKPRGQELFSPSVFPHKFDWTAEAFHDADLLHLHWLGGSFDYPTFFGSIPDELPIVWTLHDMNAFTGGCHYNSGCDRFLVGCGHCPQLGTRGENDLSRQSYAAKFDALPMDRLHVVAPSRWLLSEARNSPILSRAASFHRIPYGLDLELFQPRDRAEARQRLGLPLNRRIIAFGADEVGNHRKGVLELTESLRILGADASLLCAYFGNGKLPLAEGEGPELRSLGFVKDVDRLIDIYSAADVFVMPSLEDNLPQAGIEAIACGTPVAAFDVGGVPDFVLPGKSGALAPLRDSHALATAIRQLLDRQFVDGRPTREAAAMRVEARAVAESMFQRSRQAAAYTSLYQSILGSRLQTAAA